MRTVTVSEQGQVIYSYRYRQTIGYYAWLPA